MPTSRSMPASWEHGSHNGAEPQVAIGDQADARARLTDLGIRLSWRGRSSINDGQSPCPYPALGDQLERLAERAIEVEQVGDVRRAGDLLHVDVRAGRTSCRVRRARRRRARSACPRRRAVPSSGSTAMSTCGRPAVADLLADVEHRRLVLLALADDDHAVHRHRVEHERIASTAAWSAASLSPRPTRRAAASAAASVTRTSSSARLRSGRWSVMRARTLPVRTAG